MRTINLDEFLPEDVTVKINGREFILTANIPRGMIKKYVSFNDLNNDNAEKYLDTVEEFVTDILNLKNENAAVVKFVNGLSTIQLVKLANCISEYVKEVYSEIGKKSEKKKT